MLILGGKNKGEIMTKKNKTLIRRSIREIAKAPYNHVPIKFLDNCAPPVTKGNSFFFTNKRGDIIHYPNAYSRAWGKPIYHHSTVEVEVGKEWIKNNFNVQDADLEVVTANK